MENIYIFVCMPVICVYCFYLGSLCGRNKHRILWTLPPLLFILVLYLLSEFPAIDYLVFPFHIYGRLRFFIPLVPLIFLLGIAAQFRSNALRRVLYSSIAGFLIVTYFYIQYQIVTFDYERLQGRIGVGGCCMQSTGHTCGPAAAVTLLLEHKIPTFEKQVAKLCGSHPLTGTNEFVLSSVMNHLAMVNNKDVRFKMKKIDFNIIDNELKPFLAIIRLNGMIAHWIVIKEVSGEDITVADPLCGVVKRKKKDYADIWLKRCIVVDEKE
ncbi:cysteine peptidase family C39 domain-containing protein [Candidatus Uabimicrobium sp. HlEnr_7]|uniref:cysteine peptidase family C39 domain-containing protein n=1 Tax=Candidatus Uabimicrobium helgolandensis TaxID=3095367 RepID=UPI003557A72A